MTESVSDNDSECGGEEDNNVSDNDLEMVGDQSGTVDSTDDESGGTETPVKKTKITLTEEQERFDQQFQPVVSKIDKTRKITLQTFCKRGCVRA